jgi:hemoglobin-like flavoprotein
MNTELIAQTWEAVDDHVAFVEAFYARFFERFPAYRQLFPQRLDPAHLDKMIQTMALVTRLSEDRSTIAPHVHKLGASHKPYALQAKDLDNFKAVFVETLGARVGAAWSPAAAQAWNQAFAEVIIPLMREGGGAR